MLEVIALESLRGPSSSSDKVRVPVSQIRAGINIINSSRVLPVIGQDVGHMLLSESISRSDYLSHAL